MDDAGLFCFHQNSTAEIRPFLFWKIGAELVAVDVGDDPPPKSPVCYPVAKFHAPISHALVFSINDQSLTADFHPLPTSEGQAKAGQMSVYAEVDPIIDKWVRTLGSQLFTEWNGEPARFFYTPGDPPFEVFQISIGAPALGRVNVLARAVDTNDDTEGGMDRTWEGPIVELDQMLGSAVETIREWKTRERKKPDPPSPW